MSILLPVDSVFHEVHSAKTVLTLLPLTRMLASMCLQSTRGGPLAGQVMQVCSAIFLILQDPSCFPRLFAGDT